jgi:hypothetical protein
MSFIARCLFCNHLMQAPDRAYGSSGHSPKCSNWFTVVPEKDVACAPPRNISTAVP